jgi:hypothetical protein
MRRAILLLAALLALCPAASAAGPEGALDARAWEMVSPVQKNGGEVLPAGDPGAGVLQAAAQGGAFAFASEASFGSAAGAAPVSQYLATRGSGGWSTVNVTPSMLSGTYSAGAYLLFSADLSRVVLSSGWRCRDGGTECAAENPPLGSGAPAGYRNLYLREGAAYEPLITTANAPALAVPATQFRVSLAGAGTDLRHVVISTCAALTADAVEVATAEGCDPVESNLYEWSDGALEAVNLLPGEGETTPGASLAAPAGAVSADGSRVYWEGADGNLYLRDGSVTKQLGESVGGGGIFQAASADGQVAYFSKGGHLYRYDAGADSESDLTPAGGVLGTLGASGSGAHLYYLSATGLWHWSEGVSAKVAPTADAVNYPPATGTARLSADGTRLAFVSSASLTGYPNAGKAEIYLYDALTKGLLCVSCNPKGTPPAGPASLPSAQAAGEGGPAAYKPRALAEDGRRLFFTSPDALVTFDSNGRPDAYEWQAQGAGGCVKPSGCVGLLSSGRNGEASFADASADGTDAYFLSNTSLLAADAGAIDVYDARSGGGFPEARPAAECEGDACQGPPSAPDDSVPSTATVQGAANPPVRFVRFRCPKGKRRAGRDKGRCVAKKQPGRRHRAQRGDRR